MCPSGSWSPSSKTTSTCSHSYVKSSACSTSPQCAWNAALSATIAPHPPHWRRLTRFCFLRRSTSALCSLAISTAPAASESSGASKGSFRSSPAPPTPTSGSARGCVRGRAQRLAGGQHDINAEVLCQHEHLRLPAPVRLNSDPGVVAPDCVMAKQKGPHRIRVGEHCLSADGAQATRGCPQVELAREAFAQIRACGEEAIVVGGHLPTCESSGHSGGGARASAFSPPLIHVNKSAHAHRASMSHQASHRNPVQHPHDRRNLAHSRSLCVARRGAPARGV
eukprot:scaffold3399_cov101-Isochrysis_galbana.AAC.2